MACRRGILHLAIGLFVVIGECSVGVSQGAEMGVEEAARLRGELVPVYNSWRRAMTEGDLRTWGQVTARHRQVAMRNLVVSQGLTFPQGLFDQAVAPPGVLGMRLLEVKAAGDTAHLVYFGRVDFGLGGAVGGDGQENESLFFLHFVREESGWKFDLTRVIDLAEEPAMRGQARAGDARFLADLGLRPAGRIPAVPALCEVPDHIALLRVRAEGCRAFIRVNGWLYPPTDGGSEEHVVIGGLAEGRNELMMVVEPLELEGGQEERLLSVEVVVYPSGLGRGGRVIYRDRRAGRDLAVRIVHEGEVQAHAYTIGQGEVVE